VTVPSDCNLDIPREHDELAPEVAQSQHAEAQAEKQHQMTREKKSAVRV